MVVPHLGVRSGHPTRQGQLSVGTQMSPGPPPQLGTPPGAPRPSALAAQPWGSGDAEAAQPQRARNTHSWMDESSEEPSRAAEELEPHNAGKRAFWRVCSFAREKPLVGQEFTSTKAGLVFAVLLNSSHTGRALNDAFCQP